MTDKEFVDWLIFVLDAPGLEELNKNHVDVVRYKLDQVKELRANPHEGYADTGGSDGQNSIV